MSTLLERPIRINRIITTSTDHARAIEDPARAKILESLYRNALSADQISKKLQKAGYKKALTTVRHHLEILKTAGLIEIVKIEESRGAVTKFYGTSTRLLDYAVPNDFDSKYSKQIEVTSAKVEKILTSIAGKTSATRAAKTEDPDSGYSQYLALEIINRAIARVLENPARAGRRGGSGTRAAASRRPGPEA